MVDFTLSESELNAVDGFKEDFKKSIDGYPQHYIVVEEFGEVRRFIKDTVILAYLRTNGMNTDEPVEIVHNTHRNRHDKVVACYRFEGVERIDPEWIKSGAASWNAVISSEKEKWVGAEYMGIGAEIPKGRAA